MSKEDKIHIVGAGISGLYLGSQFLKNGKKITISEKSKGVGGRLATRRDERARYDHGAQMISLSQDEKDSKIGSLLQEWKSNSWIDFWCESNNRQLFSVQSGMTSLAKRLAENQNVLKEEKLISIQLEKEAVVSVMESGKQIHSDSLFLTCPLPQSLEILRNSSLSYDRSLENLKYAKALVGLIELESESINVENVLPPYRDHLNSEIFSISEQKSKKVSDVTCFTVNMTEAWSEENFSLQDDQILEQICQCFSDLVLSLKSKNSDVVSKQSRRLVFRSQQLKKWRYSHPLNQYHKLHYFLPQDSRVCLLGDAFGGGSILGALRSAQSLL